MAKGMIILGPAGSGKTTLGRLVAKELGIAFLDIDDYIWRADTAVPYTVMYSRQEKIDSQLTCPVLRLDGGEEFAENLAVIVEAYRKALNHNIDKGAGNG